MNAVAIMTPEPKYFAMKKAHSGTPTPRCRPAYTGNAAPVVLSADSKVDRLLCLHTEQRPDQYDEDGRYTQTYPSIVAIAGVAGRC